MRRIIAVFIFFLLYSSAFSQKKVYLSMQWEEVKKRDAIFYCVLGENENGNYPAEIFYTDETLYSKGSFNSKEISYDTRDGKFEYFFYSGKRMCEGGFKNGKKNGNWKIYYDNGVLERTGNYEDDEKIGNWFYYDFSGKITDTSEFIGQNYTGEYIRYKNGILKEKSYYLNGEYHGAIEEYYTNGVLFNTGYYDSGVRVNEWKYYNRNGNLASKIYYSKINRIDSVFYFNEDGTTYHGTIDTANISKHPEIDSSFKTIRKNLNYPPLAIENRIQGQIRTQFDVSSTGEIKNIKCIDDIKIDFGMEDECIRVIKLLKFKPHRIYNTNGIMLYTIPIKFKLQ